MHCLGIDGHWAKGHSTGLHCGQCLGRGGWVGGGLVAGGGDSNVPTLLIQSHSTTGQ